jgi:hypothetical protein
MPVEIRTQRGYKGALQPVKGDPMSGKKKWTVIDGRELNLTQMLEEILWLHVDARNSHATLVARVYMRWFGIAPSEDFLSVFKRIEMKDIPDHYDIRRECAKIQNDNGQCPPSDPAIRQRRWRQSRTAKERERDWSAWVAYCQKHNIPV